MEVLEHCLFKSDKEMIQLFSECRSYTICDEKDPATGAYLLDKYSDSVIKDNPVQKISNDPVDWKCYIDEKLRNSGTV